jgi:hypothetical protein
MNAIEFALKKQLLVLDAAAQRETLAYHAAGLTPLFDVADQVNTGVRWVGRHPEVVAGILALLLVVRPGVRRFAWRWGRRGFLAWRLWRSGNHWLNQPTHP